MKKWLIRCIFAILVLITMGCQGKEQRSLNGSWECAPFSLNKEGLRRDGSGNVHFYPNRKIRLILNYKFSFDGLGILNLSISLKGKWFPTDVGFDSLYDRVDVVIIENSTSFSNDEAKTFISEYYTLDEKESYNLDFTTRDSIVWSTSNKEDEVSCSRKID